MAVSRGMVINAESVERARQEARAGSSPTVINVIAGFLAGFVGVWIGILYTALYWVQEAFFSADSQGFNTMAQKSQFAWEKTQVAINAYAHGALSWSLIIGVAGAVFAWLRGYSSRRDAYLLVHGGERGVWSYHQFLLNAGVPLGLYTFFKFAGIPLTIWLLIITIFSGVIFNFFWSRLHNLFLRLLAKRSQDQLTADALRLLIPRQFGDDKVRIASVEINTKERRIDLTAWFANDVVEADVKRVLSDLLRGYKYIHVERINA